MKLEEVLALAYRDTDEELPPETVMTKVKASVHEFEDKYGRLDPVTIKRVVEHRTGSNPTGERITTEGPK